MKKIIEINALENGSHRNQTGIFETIPEGWAVVPDDIETPNFPFGEVEVDGNVVTKWTAVEIPKIEEETPVSEVERLRADVEYLAIMTGVEL